MTENTMIVILVVLLPIMSGLVFLVIQMMFDLRGERRRCPICNGTAAFPTPKQELLLCHQHFWRLGEVRRRHEDDF